jgi:plastocyanin
MRFFLVCAMLLSTVAAASPTVEVKMKSLSYEPKRLEITPGQAVIWRNVALTEHSATAEESPDVFDTGMIAPGKESRAISFDQVGEFPYHCSMHGKTMSGVIIVKKAPQ